MADAVPEQVKTMCLSQYGCDRHISAYSGGMFRHDILTGWSMQNAGFPKNVKIPLFITEGWFDHHLASALKTYETLSPEVKAHSVLEIGPWNHFFKIAVRGRNKSELKNAPSRRAQELLDWYEKTLIRNELPESEIRYYHIGEDKWKGSVQYPFKEGEYRRFSFAADNGSKLLIEKEEGGGMVEFEYDPDNPVPTLGGESMFITEKQRGSKQQPKPNYRSDVLSFISDPLSSPIDITGHIKIMLCVASDAEDTAFCAKVIEILPNGKSYNIRTMICSLAYREGTDQRVDYNPGTFTDLLLEAWDVSWRLQKGSRLRIDVTSSDFPQYAAHPNRKDLWCMVAKPVIAHQKIDCTCSYVQLPVV